SSYGCSVQNVEEELGTVYDWSADVIADAWDPEEAKHTLLKLPIALVRGVLLDQGISAGVGDIIKNEVTYRIRMHPDTLDKNLPEDKLEELIREARNYSFDFLEWKKQFVLKKHRLAHTKSVCRRCDLPIMKLYLGKTNRRTFFCSNCQVKYT